MKTNKKIKIVRVITRLNIGGPANHVVLLTKGLNNDKFESVLVTGSVDAHEGDMSYLAQDEGVAGAVRVIPCMKRSISPVNDLRALYQLCRILKKERPAIIHTHTAKAGFLGRLAAITMGVPIKVHSFHGHVFHSYFHPLQARFFLMVERIFSKFTDTTVVVSESVKEDICCRFKVADEARTSIVRLGLDLDKFENADRYQGTFKKELGIGDEYALIGIVGRLIPVKNHALLLNAARLLKKQLSGFRTTKVKFIVIGDGELRGELENRARELGIADDVIFTGWRRDLPVVYADIDIVALTSRNEGTPLSLIEAMAARKAVVATAVGGVPDLIMDGRTGVLVASEDAPGLAAALGALIADRELRLRLGTSASEFALAHFSKDRLVKDIIGLYEGLLVKRKEARI